ncbi:MAG TPA: hypothetical protein DHV28_13110 [Ignavibacteriales bacterium]|nr:hypothetical protein [Ignavibacteriales bacterium]
MNDFERIIEILDKESISAEEKILLDGMIENNPEAKKISRVYLRLKASLRQDKHVDEELMGEYVLYKNNLSSDRLIVLLSQMIEDHIRTCEPCENLFKDLNSEYSDVDNFVANAMTEIPTQEKTIADHRFISFGNFSTVKYAFAAIAAVFVLYLGLFAVSSFTTPDYKKSFLEDGDFYTTRGRTTELFQRGLDAIDRKDYDSAIKFMNDDISKNRNDESIFYTHFVLGITYINKAESDFIGLFKSYDKEDVLTGIDNFEKSIKLNNSGKFDNLKLDAHYFIGKAYLIINQKESAKQHLQLVIEGKGSYYKKAEDLIKDL